MREKQKQRFLDLLGKDNREIERIQKARAKRDARFFDDWFDRYIKAGGNPFWCGEIGGTAKRRKDDWL